MEFTTILYKSWELLINGKLGQYPRHKLVSTKDLALFISERLIVFT